MCDKPPVADVAVMFGVPAAIRALVPLTWGLCVVYQAYHQTAFLLMVSVASQAASREETQ